MTDTLNDHGSTKRSYGAVLAEYRDREPLLDRYWAIIEEHNKWFPITAESTTGVDNLTAAKMALAELGRPTDDLSVRMANAYVHELLAEVGQLADPQRPTISMVLADYFFTECGLFPHPEGWGGFDVAERRGMAEEIADRMPHAVVADVLELVMPKLIKHVIKEDRRTHLSVVRDEASEGGPRNWDVYRLVTAAMGGPETPENRERAKAWVTELVTDALGPEGAATVLPKDGA